MAYTTAQFVQSGAMADKSGTDSRADRGYGLPILLILPMALFSLAWLGGGVHSLTDMGFLSFTAIFSAALLWELYRFPQRFGAGAITLLGGTLIWICHDYLTYWFTSLDFAMTRRFFADVDASTLAKAAFFNGLFFWMATVGMLLPTGRTTRITNLIQEPNYRGFYFVLILVCFFIGLFPYAAFTAQPFHEAIYDSIVGGRASRAKWTLGRSGSFNYNWGAYVSVLFYFASIGAILAVIYAVISTRNLIEKTLCWGIWGFQVALAFGTGTRGHVVQLMLPAIAALFIKYQSKAAVLFQKVSLRAYMATGAVAFILVLVVQTQAFFRDRGFEGADFTVAIGKPLRDNFMFSTGIPIFGLIPDPVPFFHNRFPGEGAVRALPETLFRFAVHPIPRALWHSKPYFEGHVWITELVMGKGAIQRGGSIAPGIAGEWYMSYGLLGVIQGGLLFGWLCRWCERLLQDARGRLMQILLSLGLLVWLFRCFRTFHPSLLWPIIIGTVFIAILIAILNRMSNTRASVAPARTS